MALGVMKQKSWRAMITGASHPANCTLRRREHFLVKIEYSDVRLLACCYKTLRINT